jgi:hypothetical protein
MHRPGCVWSQVLFIEWADLAALDNLLELKKLFRRPSMDQTDSSVIQTIIYSPQTLQLVNIPDEAKCHVQPLLFSLYSNPTDSIVLEASSEQTFSEMIFAVWTQQWPRLRRSFRFSTGSFSDRGRGGEPFDIQIAPKSTYRTWSRNTTKLMPDLIGNEKFTVSQHSKDWIDHASTDLLSPDCNGFRRFLHAFGADVKNPRSAFLPLAHSFSLSLTATSELWSNVLRQTSGMFPDCYEAVRLKEAIISASRRDVDRAIQTANFLLTEREAGAFSSVSFDHAQLAPFLWRERKNQVVELLARLFRQQERPAATAFLAAIAEAVEPSDLFELSSDRPELALAFVRHRPALAFSTVTWCLPERIQWRIHETLAELRLQDIDWSKIMAAMFISATGVAVRDVVQRAGKHAIDGVFQWLDYPISSELLPSQIWKDALAGVAFDYLRECTELSPARFALCQWFIPTKQARSIFSATRNDIQNLAGTPINNLPQPLRTPVAFLLVTLGLRDKSLQATRLLFHGFPHVYEALATNDYTSESWSLIAPELPRSPIWKEWDRCKKLRRALRVRLTRQADWQRLLQDAKSFPHLLRDIALFEDESEESEEPEFLD